MNFLLENWILFVIAATSGGLLVLPLLRTGGGSGSVGTGEAVRLINREKGVLIDVAEADEYAAGHAGGARNVPLGQLAGHKSLPTNKTLPILLMCPTGARSRRAAALLRQAGYEKAVVVAGGTSAWRNASLPIEKGAAEKGAAKAGEKTA
ncbi:MAG: sulfurtransferase [Leptothrix sp. (in: Bacteria)]|nr:sulfurtransferase [Leptothrix sp. (in: b-proteobacteria)]